MSSPLTDAKTISEFVEAARSKVANEEFVTDAERIALKLHGALVQNWPPKYTDQPRGSVLSPTLGTEVCLDYRRRVTDLRKAFGADCVKSGLVTYTVAYGRKKKIGWYRLNMEALEPVEHRPANDKQTSMLPYFRRGTVTK